MLRRGFSRLSSFASEPPARRPQLPVPFAAAPPQAPSPALRTPVLSPAVSFTFTPPPCAAWNNRTRSRPLLTHRIANSPWRAAASNSPSIHYYIPSAPYSTATSSSSTAMDYNGDSRSKRKQPPTPSNDRPMKQFKPERESSEYTNGSDHHNGMDTTLDTEEPIPLTRATTTADTAEWQATVESVIKNVVSIHFCQTCSFDTDAALSSEATGFVVDAEKGYILTNRVSSETHV
jgi:hypothetical protein